MEAGRGYSVSSSTGTSTDSLPSEPTHAAGSADTSSHRSESDDQVATLDTREVRLGVVMTGGVSLCVWMGGTALEIDQLRRGHGYYGKILQAVKAKAVVDIIAGTSAGGLNGTLLASAIAWGTDLEGLGAVWLQLADLQALLRSPSEPHPNSLLKGDDYFLPRIEGVLAHMAAQGPQSTGISPNTWNAETTLHLIVTTTLMVASSKQYVDSNGVAFGEPTNLGLFHFRRGGGNDDFAVDSTDRAARSLALAARSSASFPGAFEASYVPVGTASGSDADMKQVVDFTASRYVIDGGVVDNEPLDVMLDAIGAQPATGEVTRTILFVNPLGSVGSSPGPTPLADAPSLLRVLEGVLTIPLQRSNALLYDELGLRSGQHQQIQELRKSLFGGTVQLDEPMIAAAKNLNFAAGCIAPQVRSIRLRLRRQRCDGSNEDDQTARQALLIVQDLLRRALVVCAPEERSEMRALRARISAALMPLASGTPTASPDSDNSPLLAEAMRTLVGLVEPAVPSKAAPVSRLEAPWTQLRCEVIGITAMAFAAADVTPDSEYSTDPLTGEVWTKALGDLDVLQSAVTDGDVHNPQQIDFVEISSANSAVSDRTPSQKLAGVQLFHFGAFYAACWRQNDWIWGRLDGSYRLIEVLVDPEKLLEIGEPWEMAQRLGQVTRR